MRTRQRILLLFTLAVGWFLYSELSNYDLDFSLTDKSGKTQLNYKSGRTGRVILNDKPPNDQELKALAQKRPKPAKLAETSQRDTTESREPADPVEGWDRRPPPPPRKPSRLPAKQPAKGAKEDGHGHVEKAHAHGHQQEDNVIRQISPTGQPLLDLAGVSPCSRVRGCKVIAAGTSRSGSTFLFTVARVLSQWGLRTAVAVSGHPDLERFPEMDEAFENKFSVCKTHEYVDKWAKAADVVILAHRDPRDMVASCLKMIKLRGSFERIDSFDDCLQLVKSRLWHLDKWEKLKAGKKPLVVELRYEEFAPPSSENANAIGPIAQAMGLDVSQQPRSLPRLVVEEVERVRAMTQYDWDPRTGFSKVHTSSVDGKIGQAGMWKKVLTDEQVQKVERVTGWFMDTHEYARKFTGAEIDPKPKTPSVHRGETEMQKTLESGTLKRELGYAWSKDEAYLEQKRMRKKKLMKNQ